jgi:tRNA dimethylallyltransferase
MNPDLFSSALILTGPTASGKSALGIELAEQLRAEIISMDSMALYRGMDIGTAKPTASDRARVPHHLIDVLDPWESSTLAWWLGEAGRLCSEIAARGGRALIVGGTPLYLKGILHGIFAGPPADAELRMKLEAEPTDKLHKRLRERDPLTASRLHPNDRRRLVRALEVLELTGRPMSHWQQQFTQIHDRTTPPVWLDLPRTALYARIDQRVRDMFAGGLVEEVIRLRQLPQPLSKEARQALGYKEVLERLAAGTHPCGALEQVQTRSRNFAKRQLTWFRHLPQCMCVPIAATEGMAEITRRVRQAWERGCGGTA